MKGISPIVSVVLVIAISIIASIGVYFWLDSETSKMPTPEPPIPILVMPTPSNCSEVIISHLGTAGDIVVGGIAVSAENCTVFYPEVIPPGGSAKAVLKDTQVGSPCEINADTKGVFTYYGNSLNPSVGSTQATC